MRRIPLPNPADLRSGLRGCCLFSTAAVIALMVLAVAACGAAIWTVSRASAAPLPTETPVAGVDVVLAIDQSHSLFDLGGIGSDPGQLRMEAARLFAAYLGIDEAPDAWRLGVVQFGTQADLTLAPIALHAADGPTRLEAALGPAEPAGWTDLPGALAAAAAAARPDDGHADRRAEVVLFTDGRPEMANASDGEQLERLRAAIDAVATRGVGLTVVLLQNAATDADPVLRDVYLPLWTALAAAGQLQFHAVRDASDLPAVYREIVLDLRGGQTLGAVLDGPADTLPAAAVPVADGWRHLDVVAYKADPSARIDIAPPPGAPIDAGTEPRRVVSPDGRVEVLRLAGPAAGNWTLSAVGPGDVRVWVDYEPADATPTPENPTLAPAPPTATPRSAPLPGPVRAATTDPSIPRTATTGPTHGPAATPAVPSEHSSRPLTDGVTESSSPVERAKGGSPRHSTWLGIGLLAAIAVAAPFGYAATRRRRAAAPRLEGRLRRTATPVGSPGGVTLLDGRARVVIGSAPDCDVVLGGDPAVPARAAALQAIQAADGPIASLEPVAGARVDVGDAAVTTSRRLVHGDLIRIGAHVLRYENVLAARRPGAR